MKDIFIVAIIALIIFSAAFYIYHSKKKGKKCVGCPYADCCSGGCNVSGNKNE